MNRETCTVFFVNKPKVDYHTVLFNKDIFPADPLQNILKKVGCIRSTKIKFQVYTAMHSKNLLGSKDWAQGKANNNKDVEIHILSFVHPGWHKGKELLKK